MSKKPGFKYKTDHTLEERQNESSRILRDYQNRLPVICEKAPNSEKLPFIKKTKYLVPYDMTVSQFHFLIRRNLDLNENYALFLVTPKGKSFITLTGDQTMMEAYNIYKDKQDNFLYLYYEEELTWG